MIVAIEDLLRQNLTNIQKDIDAACERSGRSTDEVRLVAVTKYADWHWVEVLSGLYRTFGENRPQQLAERQVMLPSIEWHLIGQLQRNKVRLALQHASVIHSIDSLKLLERIAQATADLPRRPRILLQVNLSHEASKSGFEVEQLRSEWPAIVSHVDKFDIDGFMTMAAESEDPEDARPVFRDLRLLRDELRQTEASVAAGLELRQLSMGMSGDFIPAIEEGATLVRIGSKVFAGLADHP